MMKKEQKKKPDDEANVFFGEYLIIRDKKTGKELYRGRGND